jgi:arabinose-5-phosphate isomerase
VALSASEGALPTVSDRTGDALAAARRALEIESRSIGVLAQRIGSELTAAVELLMSTSGRVVVSGLGKSGHVGRKIAATLASTGTPAFFVHATEALHGDAGMLTGEDVGILISNSGETAEVCQFGALLLARGIPVIAMTGQPGSTLARLAAVHLMVAVEREADPLDLAPTASTTAVMAMGDALAAALMVMRDFRHEDFAMRHPGGSLGQRLAPPTSETQR